MRKRVGPRSYPSTLDVFFFAINCGKMRHGYLSCSPYLTYFQDIWPVTARGKIGDIRLSRVKV